MFVGARLGGTGTYNLAKTDAVGGTLTGFGTGTGSLNVGGPNAGAGRLYVGGDHVGPGTGTFNVNTSGLLKIGNDLSIGSSGGVGVVNVDAGTVTTNGWNFIGRREAADGGNGTLNMSGGTLDNLGARTFIGLGNTVGAMNLSGGTYNNIRGGDNNTQFAVGVLNNANAATPTLSITGTGMLNANRLFTVGGNEAFGGDGNADFIGSGKGAVTVNGAGAQLNVTGEFFVGQGVGSTGTMTVGAGTVTGNNWMVIGRNGATGTMSLTGGTVQKSGPGAFAVGTNDGAVAILNVGGTANLVIAEPDGSANSNNMILSEFGTGSGTVSQTGGTVSVGGDLIIAGNGAANAGGTGTYSLTGGTLDMTGGTIRPGGGTATFVFGGGTLKNAATVNMPLNQTGGTLSPGASPGTTVINAAYTLGAGGTYLAELDSGGTSDLIDVNNLATLAGTLDVAPIGTLTLGQTFTIMNYDTLAGTFAGRADDSTFSENGYSFLINYNAPGNAVTLTVQAVPEPGTIGLAAIAAAGALLRRRRTARPE
jgi:hypothetical protein